MAFFSPAAISHLTAGRSQIGTSLSFHLFFAVLISLCTSAATAETATHRPYATWPRRCCLAAGKSSAGEAAR